MRSLRNSKVIHQAKDQVTRNESLVAHFGLELSQVCTGSISQHPRDGHCMLAMPVIPGLWRQRQAGLRGFEVSLVYI